MKPDFVFGCDRTSLDNVFDEAHIMGIVIIEDSFSKSMSCMLSYVHFKC
jgi:hypothetical protein